MKGLPKGFNVVRLTINELGYLDLVFFQNCAKTVRLIGCINTTVEFDDKLVDEQYCKLVGVLLSQFLGKFDFEMSEKPEADGSRTLRFVKKNGRANYGKMVVKK